MDDARVAALPQPQEETVWRVTPTIEWLILDGWRIDSTPRLIETLGQRLNAEGVPVGRIFCLVPALHPLYVGAGYRWTRGEAQVWRGFGEHGINQRPTFLKNPPKLIIVDGYAAVRRRLDDGYVEGEFPLLDELKAEGATDYVAMPLEFTSGQRTVISFTSDAPGGFAPAHLKQFYDMLPVLARLIEQDVLRSTTENLLRTYVGRDAATRILSGQVTRGAYQTIYVAVWYADLRDFTGLTQTLSREDLLGVLNGYFEAMAQAIDAHGGQILKFIGDGLLAIFPVDALIPAERACGQALAAARQAAKAMAALNAGQAARGLPPVGYGLALHLGEVTYGNIGAADRLDFTVIGPAVNLAHRLEQLCKLLELQPLLSRAFAEASAAAVRPVGRFVLRSLPGEHEVLTLAD